MHSPKRNYKKAANLRKTLRYLISLSIEQRSFASCTKKHVKGENERLRFKFTFQQTDVTCEHPLFVIKQWVNSGKHCQQRHTAGASHKI